jgi:iron(III) transport system substrate-binding protein
MQGITARCWASVFVAVWLAVGCGPSATPPAASAPSGAGSGGSAAAAGTADSWDNVVERARREGQVSILSNPGHRAFMEHAIPAFEQQYGIKVDIAYTNGRETTERVMAEVGAAQVRTDVAGGGDTNVFELVQNDAVEAYAVPNADGIAAAVREKIGPGNTYYPTMLVTYALLANTQAIPPDRLPRRWADLTDPYYKGKIVIHNPATNGGGNTWLAGASEDPSLGRPYLEKIAQQDLLVSQDPATVEATVARGERGIGLPGVGRAVVTQAGAPIKWIIPEEGVVYSVDVDAVPRGAPHPNAARVWVNFILSPEAQAWWHPNGRYTPVRIDVEVAEPEYLLSNLKLLGTHGTRAPQDVPKWLDLGKSIFGR